ncbi:polysaccharide deacetylase family protein [Streptomyces kaniharaensis]|uniref:Polysaccharide deacetylase family protein n=1 Tax=Streptomyces kaniharaensis TaxID=212423 RepID=A0A6N7L1U4_9ACTN|nr:polysaccharide deacetylase family protein [Streptomyces kaniharaensis]MQS17740.1 polysaccharide deacetylase family protein [Streptomyces kaniharaensis]
MKRLLAAAATLLALVAAGPPPASLLGAEIRRIPTDERVVALTFNAAWDETGLETVLAVLRDRAAPAAFFPTGDFADRNPGAVRTIAAAGHGLGNHSYSHPQFAGLTRQQARGEVQRADTAIRRAAGTDPLPFFRFPYSETTPEATATVNELGFADLEFTTDTNGYLGPAHGMTAARATERALAALTPGAILQLHVGATEEGGGQCLDAEALPAIIDGARSRGYRIVDLRTLLSG